MVDWATKGGRLAVYEGVYLHGLPRIVTFNRYLDTRVGALIHYLNILAILIDIFERQSKT